MLTQHSVVPADRRISARTLVGVGALIVHAIRSGRTVLICDASSSEQLVLDAPPGSTFIGRSAVRWHLAEEGGGSDDDYL